MSQLLARDSVAVNPRRAYITTSSYDTDLYTYTVTTNPTTFVQTGTLAANVTGATASTCPPNRILRENGKRLYPDANPQISTLMVGVYDSVSGLNGYIDPNSPKFAVYNSDKAHYIPNGVDPSTGLVDRGNPVYTRGTITSGDTITAQTNVNVSTGVTLSTGQIRSAAVTALTAYTGTANANANINPALGQVFTQTIECTGGTPTISIRCHDGTNPIVPPAGSVVYLLLTTSAAHTTACTVAAGTNVKMISQNIATTASRTYGLTFVSNGSSLIQVGGDIATTAGGMA